MKEKPLYDIIRGISSDTLNRKHEAGETGVDLSAWPQDVIKRWIERGIIKVSKKPVEKSSKRYIWQIDPDDQTRADR